MQAQANKLELVVFSYPMKRTSRQVVASLEEAREKAIALRAAGKFVELMETAEDGTVTLHELH